MEAEFEFLPFQPEGESLEGERGRGAARRPAVRVQKGPPRKRPGPVRRPRWPAGGGWPFEPVVVAPQPVYAAEPEPEPEPEPDSDADPAQEPGQDEFGWHAEIPATLQASLARLPAPLRPNYMALGSLAAALRDPRSNVPGLYLIEFNVAGQPRAYSGQSQNVRRRLQQHLLCAGMLGLPVSGHRAFVAPLAHLAPAQRRDIEQRIHTDMLARQPGVLTNQRRELEAEFGATTKETIMQNKGCRCERCQNAAEAELEVLEFAAVGPFGEAEEIGLAMELLSVASEEELDQFLGKMFKKVGRFVGKVAKPLGGVLKGLAKKALPFVGSALGSFIPIPGVGTALGGALGGALAKALEMETAGLEGEERELEMARRFVRIAGSAAQQAALAGPAQDPQRAAQRAVNEALRAHLPGMEANPPRAVGSWRRQPCGTIVIEL